MKRRSFVRGMVHSDDKVCSQHQTWDVIYIKTAPALKGTAGKAGAGSLKTLVSHHTCDEHPSCMNDAIAVNRYPVKRRQHGTDFSKVTPNKTFCNTERCVEPQLGPPRGFWSQDQRTLQVPERGPRTPGDTGCCGAPSLCFSAALLPVKGGGSCRRDASPGAAASTEVWSVLLFCLDLLKDSRLKSDS